MTRLALLADIHGNLPALEAVIEDMAQFAVDHVVVAGDSVNWGPCSRQVMEIITERAWALIRGNNELYVLDHDTERAPPHWASFTMPPYPAPAAWRYMGQRNRLPARYASTALSRCAANSRRPRHTRQSLGRHGPQL